MLHSEEISTAKGKITLLHESQVIIEDGSSLLDVLFSISSDTLVISKENLSEAFFDLKTGIAGEILQKVSNYRKRLVVLGNFDHVKRKSLKDFIFESNKNGQVIFVNDLNKAIELLK